ncbi:MAG TPA: glycoside hydrolase family 2 protein, partial [Armatimonadota bacterium]|nr:glycoside hydrolase family 2 protein [Armatimonadota bacterium]
MLNLNGTWKLKDFDPGQGLAQGAQRPETDTATWIDVAVPGDVHRALVASGRLAEPFDDQNIEACEWVERREWWYRTVFTSPVTAGGERIVAEFDGLDTFATVYVNGQEVGRSANMLVESEFDVTDALHPGAANTLAICFSPTVATIEQRDNSRFWSAFYTPRVWVRKAQMNFGWDWGPRLVTVGIWRGARLTRRGPARIESHYVRTHAIDEEGAVVLVGARVEDREPAAEPLGLSVSLSDGDRTFSGYAEVSGNRAEVRLVVPQPRLWWSNGLGEPFRHDVRIDLVQEGAVADSRADKVGLRTIRLLQEPDGDGLGSGFTFVLNGRKVFCKGADWIPVDSFIGSAPPERYRALVRLARDAHMNMLRVWGGGVYEHDAFYEACDDMGILVWQDFMFSCASYPDFDEAFVAEVAREAELVVKRLRNRACVALWCGNNENQWIDDMCHTHDPQVPLFGQRLYDEVLPGVVARLDPTRPYWPGSPYGGNDHNSEREGDRHNWQVWAGQVYPRRFGEPAEGNNTPEGVSFRHYAEDECRFCSEFGIHASPMLRTLQRHVKDGVLEYDSPAFLYRIKDPDGTRKVRMMEAHIGQPRDLDEYATYSMLVQAEGLKFGIEHYRRRMFLCGGALLWQLNDCWPGISWSVIDYYLNPKAGYYYVKRACAPVLVSFQPESDGVSVWLTNDTWKPVETRIRLTVRRVGDATPVRQIILDGAAGANSSRPFGRFSAADLGVTSPATECLAAEHIGGEPFETTVWFFEELKSVTLPAARVSLEWSEVTSELPGYHTYSAVLRSDQFAYFVGLEFPVDGVECSSNYGVVLPGAPVTLRVTSP